MHKREDIHVNAPNVKGIELNRVGVSNIPFPLCVKGKAKKSQPVKAIFDMFGSLRHDVKGIDMSRFPEALSIYSRPNYTLTGKGFKILLERLLKSLNRKKKSPVCDDVYARATFSYRVPRYAPVSRKKSFMYYDCAFIGRYRKNSHTFVVEVKALVTSLCPCSKNLCTVDVERDIGRGAHNQKGLVSVQIASKPSYPGLKLEDIINVIEESASGKLYTILKRPDEKYVTEQAYAKPMFVEDIARGAMAGLRKLKKTQWIRVKVENFESIHVHSAVAYCEYSKEKGKWIRTSKGFF